MVGAPGVAPLVEHDGLHALLVGIFHRVNDDLNVDGDDERRIAANVEARQNARKLGFQRRELREFGALRTFVGRLRCRASRYRRQERDGGDVS
jgi:hypothetical protein